MRITPRPSLPETAPTSSSSINTAATQRFDNNSGWTGTLAAGAGVYSTTGTTAEGLINKTPCSALAVKPADFHFSLH